MAGRESTVSVLPKTKKRAPIGDPFHVERGFAADASTVTAISADSCVRASDLDGTKGEGILTNFARRMDGPSGPEAIMVICPEHAKIIAGDGFSKADVQKFLWERAGHRMSEVPEETFHQRVKRRPDLKLTRESVIPVTDTPEDIIVVVAGRDALSRNISMSGDRARRKAVRRGR